MLWRTFLFLAWTLVCVVIASCGTGAAAMPANRAESPDLALHQLLDHARSELPGACDATAADRLERILCAGRIRIGVRADYPQFAESHGKTWHGYEIDLARAIAKRLGVAISFVVVTPANRIAMLAENRIDLAIATMGDNTQRDTQARFIHPHYYESKTILVGPRNLPISGWRSVAGKTVCVTVGNDSNDELWSHGARLMLFDAPGQLVHALRDHTCSLVAQDNSFFAHYFLNPEFASSYNAKLGFAPVPWGMAVALHGTARLARALALISQIFNRDGVLLDMARANHVSSKFLADRQGVWRQPACNTATGSSNPVCVLPPLNVTPQPTRFATAVTAVETWLETTLGIRLSLPMLKTVPAWSLFRSGVINSLMLTAGALAATLLVALLFSALLVSRLAVLRWPTRMMVGVAQSTPPVMALVIAATVGDAIGGFSSSTLIMATIVALGLVNGANAGQAVSEAVTALQAEEPATTDKQRLYMRAVGRSGHQIEAFLINAAKATPIASFIGTPGLLNALTDVSSFSRDGVTTYWLVLLFYMLIVMLVVWLCVGLRRILRSRGAVA